MKKNFTLIELLVVIAIIAILAGLVMPALGQAQARGKTTECLNNKKQLMTAMRMYASDYDGMMVYQAYVGNELKNYAYLFAGKGTIRQQTSEKILVCNTAKKALNADATNAAGMLDADFVTPGSAGDWYKENKAILGRFVSKPSDSNDKSIAYVLEKLKLPTDTIIFADTYSVDSSDQESPFWSFVPNLAKTSFNRTATTGVSANVALVHGNETTVAFADGRAEAMGAGKLKESKTKITHYLNSNFEAKDSL